MIDIIFLAFNRLAFTKAAMAAMLANTDWSLVRKLVVYDDGSSDGTIEYLKSVKYPAPTAVICSQIGGPVAITKNYLMRSPSSIFAKIDNDTMLPPGWLGDCMKVMERNPGLDLLGIEAFHPVQPAPAARAFVPAAHIGGIGLMRRRCFRTLPKHHGPGGRFGFTEWQRSNKDITKGWLDPALPVFLLDRMPTEPWAGLSRQYVKRQWQRPWPAPYPAERAELWSWFENA